MRRLDLLQKAAPYYKIPQSLLQNVLCITKCVVITKRHRTVTRKYIFISFVLLRDYFKSLNFCGKNGELSSRVAYKLRKKMKNSPSRVHVLHKTLNGVISRCCFAEDGKEMYQNVKRTFRAMYLLIKPIVLRRCRCHCRRRCLSSQIDCGDRVPSPRNRVH